MEYKITGYCDNCKEFETVYYDYHFQKYWCKNCKKVRGYSFVVMEVGK